MIDTLKLGAKHRWFTCDQAATIIKIYTYSSDQVKALKIIAPKLVDRQNSHIIIPVFTYSSDKKKAKEILMQY